MPARPILAPLALANRAYLPRSVFELSLSPEFILRTSHLLLLLSPPPPLLQPTSTGNTIQDRAPVRHEDKGARAQFGASPRANGISANGAAACFGCLRPFRPYLYVAELAALRTS